MRLWHLALITALGLLGCGGDESGTGPVAGPSSVLQVNCPGSGTGGGLVTPTTRVGAGATGVGATCPTCTRGTCLTCQAKSRRLQGVPVQGDNSVGDTRIDVTADCGDITFSEPAPVVANPVVIQPVVITP
jgi:hypothetical protein